MTSRLKFDSSYLFILALNTNTIYNQRYYRLRVPYIVVIDLIRETVSPPGSVSAMSVDVPIIAKSLGV